MPLFDYQRTLVTAQGDGAALTAAARASDTSGSPCRAVRLLVARST